MEVGVQGLGGMKLKPGDCGCRQLSMKMGGQSWRGPCLACLVSGRPELRTVNPRWKEPKESEAESEQRQCGALGLQASRGQGGCAWDSKEGKTG